MDDQLVNSLLVIGMSCLGSLKGGKKLVVGVSAFGTNQSGNVITWLDVS